MFVFLPLVDVCSHLGLIYLLLIWVKCEQNVLKSNVTLIWVVKLQPCIKLNRLIR